MEGAFVDSSSFSSALASSFSSSSSASSASSASSSPSARPPRPPLRPLTGLAAQMKWGDVWASRFAARGTAEHCRWSAGLYERLASLAREFYAFAFPRTDAAIREQAWTAVWTRWTRRAPGRDRSFDSDAEVTRYVRRSLANSLRSLLRRRTRRARLEREHVGEIGDVIHAGGDGFDGDRDPVERAERLAALRRVVTFFERDLLALLSGRRAGRATEVVRLVDERFAQFFGGVTFADVVAREARPGQAARTVENRVRQRYGRALEDVLAAIDGHKDALIAADHDPLHLRRFAVQLFSDRAPPRRRPVTPAPAPTSTRRRWN